MHAFLILFPLLGVLLVMLNFHEVCGAGELNRVCWANGPFNRPMEKNFSGDSCWFIASCDI